MEWKDWEFLKQLLSLLRLWLSEIHHKNMLCVFLSRPLLVKPLMTSVSIQLAVRVEVLKQKRQLNKQLTGPCNWSCWCIFSCLWIIRGTLKNQRSNSVFNLNISMCDFISKITRWKHFSKTPYNNNYHSPT